MRVMINYMEDIIMDYETKITKEDIEKNKGIAALSYLLFFLPLILHKTQSLQDST